MKARAAYTDVALLKRLMREARGYWPHIGAIFGISLLAAPLALLTPVPLKIAVDSVLGSHPVPGFLDAVLPAGATGSDTALLGVIAVMFVAIAVLTQIQDMGNNLLQTYTGEKLLLRFRGKLFQHIQRLSLAYHDRIGTADSTYRIQYDAMSLQYIAVQSVISLITAVSTLAAMLYVTYRIDPELALVALAVSPPILFVAKVFRPRMREVSREVKKLESSALSVVQEVFTGLRVVKAFGQEDREQERFSGRFGEGMRARIRLVLVQGAYSLLIATMIGAGGGAVLFVGVHHVQQGTITLGDLLLVMGYLTQLYAPLKTMARKAGSLQNYLASAERAFGILDEAPEVPERPNPRRVARASGAIQFRDVSFAYEPGRPVLHGVSFAVKPGERVGVAGSTGAGKSTLMSLLTRFYDPNSGGIMLDGVDLREYRLADLRNQFGIVLQEPVLFSTSIAENIAYARPDASEAEIAAAAAAANAHDFITGLPDGYATLVGERGMRLSGGERQRISLARAFLKDAPILILDEPTSSVDVNTEAVIMDAMDRLMSGRTSFMIAHRLSTLDVCEKRLELDKGRIAPATLLPSGDRRRRRMTPVLQTPSVALPNGNGATGRTGDVVESDKLSEHPAVMAWLWLAGKKPQRVRVLKAKRFRKRGAYQLEGAGPGGSAVIAKICKRKVAEIESAVYEQLLPRLPMPSLRYYGKVQDGDGQHCWLFLEDAGADPYSPGDPEHRRLAARWLAAVRVHAPEVLEASDLPDRGPRHYLVHLLKAREEIVRQLRRQQDEADGPLVLENLLSKLDVLESHWGELAAFCDALPQTFVHGDLVPKNLRIMRKGSSNGLAIFDWETAGLGVQAPDLAQLLEPECAEIGRRRRSKRFDRFSANPCLDTYSSLLRASGIEMDSETLERSAAIGNLFRCLAGIDWACLQATTDWCPVDDFRVYSGWLGNAMELAGLSIATVETSR